MFFLIILFFLNDFPALKASMPSPSTSRLQPSSSSVSCPTTGDRIGLNHQKTYYKSKENLWMSGCPEYVIWEHEVVSDESCMVQCFHNGRCESFHRCFFSMVTVLANFLRLIGETNLWAPIYTHLRNALFSIMTNGGLLIWRSPQLNPTLLPTLFIRHQVHTAVLLTIQLLVIPPHTHNVNLRQLTK